MQWGEKIAKLGRQAKRELTPAPGSVDPILYGGIKKLVKDLKKSRAKADLEDYEPQIIARGGEHLVFELQDPKHPDTVIKINFQYSRPMLRAINQGPQAVLQARDLVKDRIKNQTQELRTIRNYFGQQTVPAGQNMIRELPVNFETIAVLDPGFPVTDSASIPRSTPAMITVQRRVELPPGDRTVSLTGYYPEKSLQSDELGFSDRYFAGHEILTGGLSNKPEQDIQIKYILDMYPDMAPIAKKAKSDPKFRQKLKDSVETMIKMTQETGIIIDLAGKNNVVLIKKDGNWDIKLIDPLHADGTNLESLQKAVSSLSAGSGAETDSLKLEEIGNAFNALNTLRVINALATISGSSARLNIPGLSELSPGVWSGLFFKTIRKKGKN
ncbi:MAG: hypothetical protein ACOYUZ_02880 [Patescibacteria group bacterium]